MNEHASLRARKLLDAGLAAAASGNIPVARAHFRASASECPTADALTYWGWMEHQLGNTDLAIHLCKQAIERDPDFGNPYNDIGSYLIQQGDLDGAVPWLEKAIGAKRYEARHYPHVNLARIHLTRQHPVQAAAEFRKALALRPDDPELAAALAKVLQSVN